MNQLVLIKVGGGLITDKSKPLSLREDMMLVVAEAIRVAHEKHPEDSFIIGNGAGSFGHFLASKDPDGNKEERMTAIHESVVLLNKIFVQHLVEAGLPAVSVVPSEHITAEYGKLKEFDIGEIEDVLSVNSISVLFGDIVDDGTDKGMIFSTETLFEELIKRMRAEYEITLIYAGDTDGVLDVNSNTIREISMESWKKMGGSVAAPSGYDVTGGMTHKIESALKMTRYAKSVHIILGKDPQSITAALDGAAVGTKIVQ